MFWNKKGTKKENIKDIAAEEIEIDPMEQVMQLMVAQGTTDYRRIQEECKVKFETREYIIREGMIEISGFTFCMGLSSIFEIVQSEEQPSTVIVSEKIDGLMQKYYNALMQKAKQDGMSLELIGIVLNASKNNIVRTFQIPGEVYGSNVSDIQLAVQWNIQFPMQ